MSSSRAEGVASALAVPIAKKTEGRLARPRVAMTTRMTLYYALATCLILAGASIFLYWGLERSLLKSGSDFLDYKLQVLQRLVLTRPLPRRGIDQEAQDEAELSEQSATPFFIRVFWIGASGRRLITETSGLGAKLPSSVFPVSRSPGLARGRWQGVHHWLLASQRIADPGAWPDRENPSSSSSDGVGWEIEAAVNVDSAYGLLRAYRLDLFVALGAGLLLAAASGVWVARRGLVPLTDITRVTEHIGAEQLADRLAVSAWPAELTALASAYNRMLDRLEQSFERLSQFSADLAHELRTPINNLMGEAQVALSQHRSADDYERVLQSGLEELARLARMIDSMLFLARAEQAQTQTLLQREVLQASQPLHAVVEFFDPLAQEQQVALTHMGEAPLFADPQLLRRALSNLVSNALRYTPAGGRVTVEVGSMPDGSAAVRVRDSGTGIAPEHLPRLGDRFYRVDPARSDSAAGAGLGLALVKSIMQLHGGRLQIESELGGGTVVSLFFPASPT